MAHSEETVRTAEALGFHSVWFMDHLAAPGDPTLDTFDGWTTAAVLARRTERIRLGHLALANPLRHPAVLAKMAVTLDAASEGRFDLGLGWGSVPEEFDRFGVPAGTGRERAMALAETIEILERMFSGQPFSFKGRDVPIADGIGRPVPQGGRIPLHVCGGGKRLTMPLVRRYADWWNCPSYAVDRFPELRALAGSARVSVQHPVGLVTRRSQTEEVEAEVARRFGSWGGVVTGNPTEVATAFAAEARLGAELFVVQFSDFATTATMRLFAREVMPAVRSARRR